MPRKKTSDQIIAKRRAIVGKLRARAMTIDEITDALARPEADGGYWNPETGEPWSRPTVIRDIHALTAEWREIAAADIADHKARQLSEIQAVKSKAWEIVDLQVLIRALKREADLLGLDQPKKIEIGVMFSEATLQALAVLEQHGIKRDSIGDAFERWIQAYADQVTANKA